MPFYTQVDLRLPSPPSCVRARVPTRPGGAGVGRGRRDKTHADTASPARVTVRVRARGVVKGRGPPAPADGRQGVSANQNVVMGYAS
jgi:hypothetical protein